MKKFAICRDKMGWWARLVDCARAAGMDFDLVDIERSDWIERIRDSSCILWRPNLDPPFCDEAKEKIYFMETFLRKRVVPNWATFWHYDNKRAQAYLFQTAGIPTPRTWVSFSREEALKAVREISFPIVSKTAGGAASTNVRLLRTSREAIGEIKTVFDVGKVAKVAARLRMDLRLTPRTRNRYVLWQEFVPGNERDLRVTVIGKDHVFAFWRNNRRRDFRASGSGSMDYQARDVERECLYCAELCYRYNFDSMAFDILYREKEFVIVEMSYAFNDRAVYDAPGHYRVDSREQLTWLNGHVWPQKLMIDYVERVMGQSDAPTGERDVQAGGSVAGQVDRQSEMDRPCGEIAG